LTLSPFTLDDYGHALHHATREPRCILLAEIHGVLINEIIAQPLRLQGTVVTTSTGPMPTLAADRLEDDMSPAERERFIRRALSYSRKWDRSARLKSKDGRQNWVRYLIGVLGQRGGLESIPTLPRIFKHLFNGDDGRGTAASSPSADRDPNDDTLTSLGDDDDNPADESIEASEALSEDTNVDTAAAKKSADDFLTETRYWTLPISDKLAILTFLCDLILSSKRVRAYIDECENELTSLRKEHIELTRERKTLMAQKLVYDIEDGKPPRKKPRLSAAATAAATAAAAAPVEPAVDAAPTTAPSTGAPKSGAPDGSDDLSSLAPTQGADDDEGDQIEDEEDDDEEIDELASSSAASESGHGGGTAATTAARQAALRDRLAQREVDEKQVKPAVPTAATTKAERRRLEEHMAANTAQEEVFDREFRRYRDVTRLHPLGHDRFHCAYWWFDGVGAMALIGPGGGALYGTGRLIVQGPSRLEWDAIVAGGKHGDEVKLEARRIEEEGAEATRLGPGEWAAITTEAEVRAGRGRALQAEADAWAQLDELVAWLNVKGVREVKLKEALTKWRPYLVGGMVKRAKDQRDPETVPRLPNVLGDRRSARTKGLEPDPTPVAGPVIPSKLSSQTRYLVWTNRLAVQ
jgi:hypothetical protein